MMLKIYKFLPLLFIFFPVVLSSSSSYSVIVDCQHSGEPGAIINGKPTFKTIKDALKAAEGKDDSPFIIYIRKGYYYEKTSIDYSNIRLIGEDRDNTIITYDATADSRDSNGTRYDTRGSFTLRITKPDFRAENLTIENSFDYPGNAAKSDDDSTKIKNMQAVAVMTTVDSDRTIFRNCIIRGYQDTLFPDSGRHYFYQCDILGHVDFIFGAGQAVFDNCNIISRNRENKNPTGYITAPSTSISYPFGFLFIDCRLTKEKQDIPAGSVRLGRPWHPSADPQASGSAVFIKCFMDDHIGSIGYAPISSRDSTGQRIWFEVDKNSRFFEFECDGPGVIKSSSRPVLSKKAATWYSISNVLNGWIPEVE
jgi:pectinesterase